ncbi:hypothetical protein AKJ16_DCAP01571 [Drosera capensis]
MSMSFGSGIFGTFGPSRTMSCILSSMELRSASILSFQWLNLSKEQITIALMQTTQTFDPHHQQPPLLHPVYCALVCMLYYETSSAPILAATSSAPRSVEKGGVNSRLDRFCKARRVRVDYSASTVVGVVVYTAYLLVYTSVDLGGLSADLTTPSLVFFNLTTTALKQAFTGSLFVDNSLFLEGHFSTSVCHHLVSNAGIPLSPDSSVERASVSFIAEGSAAWSSMDSSAVVVQAAAAEVGWTSGTYMVTILLSVNGTTAVVIEGSAARGRIDRDGAAESSAVELPHWISTSTKAFDSSAERSVSVSSSKDSTLNFFFCTIDLFIFNLIGIFLTGCDLIHSICAAQLPAAMYSASTVEVQMSLGLLFCIEQQNVLASKYPVQEFPVEAEFPAEAEFPVEAEFPTEAVFPAKPEFRVQEVDKKLRAQFCHHSCIKGLRKMLENNKWSWVSTSFLQKTHRAPSSKPIPIRRSWV